ncbi:MAG TPA: DUF4157 domain-containing protein [Bacillota bacterium]|nr:DUF4157 domain-containing protein [Bacillota bacterium]
MIYDHSRQSGNPYLSVNTLIHRRQNNGANGAPLQTKLKNPAGETTALPDQKAATTPPINQPSAPVQRKGNPTGLPDNLKTGMENFSGIDMSDVRVHYNSPKPGEVSALAYTQGKDIHVAPGQEKHLPHEAWHVVQQAQGRVKPTMQLMGVPVNDEAELEQEASEIGDKIQKTNGIDGHLQRTPRNATIGQLPEPAATAQLSQAECAGLKESDQSLAEVPWEGEAGLVQRQESPIGMRDSLKSGLEGWTGLDIGEERTRYKSGKSAINDVIGSEKNANVMRAKALQTENYNSPTQMKKTSQINPSLKSMQAPIQRLKKQLGDVSDKKYQEMRRYAVYLYAEFKGNSVGIFKTEGGKHAEENLIDCINKLKPKKGDKLTIWLSTSPCSSIFLTRKGKGKGCMELLEDLQKTTGIEIKVYAANLYLNQELRGVESDYKKELGMGQGLHSLSAVLASSLDIEYEKKDEVTQL